MEWARHHVEDGGFGARTGVRVRDVQDADRVMAHELAAVGGVVRHCTAAGVTRDVSDIMLTAAIRR